jgi:hypothetical protein
VVIYFSFDKEANPSQKRRVGKLAKFKKLHIFKPRRHELLSPSFSIFALLDHFCLSNSILPPLILTFIDNYSLGLDTG